MNRIEKCFEELKKENKKALITFITSGDPDLETTEKTALKMFESGADIIELGVPFSDPVAEGVTIQKASLRALKGGVNLDGIFDTVKKIREKTDKPLLLMMYINTIFVYGAERFFSNCKEYGIDGVIVPDMPYEEREEILDTAEKYGIINVNLVAPTSHDRIKEIASHSKGFLYCVSSTGVTGVRSSFTTDFDSFFGTIKQYASCPCAVGFGISGPEAAKKMSSYCDGVIVGSAIVRILEEKGADGAEDVGSFVRSLKDAM
ncbi:MAG: tryptophan synthase subunit alpha [Firmicutes bacterium]|nr:tryptophan synthase subunit alpha [[Eubacterium] siraeum]MCM1487651.1 tryptophan synthase subunit alpha [Bacillota bacterium]